MNNDAERLREKVSQETAKIIKLKVAQDTAYWDLKEKLQQVEGNHERLQQNMVEVQMQHEAISGQYQEELRLRPDTLNKLSGTRHICDVLEEYGERLRQAVARCRLDQRALGAAYGECGARVRSLGDAARERHASAHHVQRMHERLGEARAQASAQSARCHDLADQLERTRTDLRRCEQAAGALQADAARLLRERDEQCAELRRALATRDAEIQTTRAHFEEAQRERDAERLHLRRITDERAEAAAMIDQLKIEVTSLGDDKSRMEIGIDEKNERVATLEMELGHAKEHQASTELLRREAEDELRSARQQAEAQASTIEELTRRILALERAVAEAQAAAAAQQAADARRVDELGASLAERDRELDDKVRTIARLMADLKAEADERARADTALAAARRQLDAERAEFAVTLAGRDAAARSQNDEIRAQLDVILDLRTERERMEECMRAKQATIDNIQKELTGRAPPPLPAAERECDAALSPTKRELIAPPRPADRERNATPRPGKRDRDVPQRPTGRERERDASPRPNERERDRDVLYGFLSDSSVDGDALSASSRCHLSLHAMRPQATVSLSQVRKDLKMKGRTFFKNKRLESKIKKIKD